MKGAGRALVRTSKELICVNIAISTTCLSVPSEFEGYSRADPASAGRRLVPSIGAGEGIGDELAVRE
jgi:hypothetical protein